MGLGDLARRVGRTTGANSTGGAITEDGLLNIIEFIESPFGLRFSKELSGSALFPVQKFILKMFYHLELETNEKVIKIPRSWRHVGSTKRGSHYRFTEQEYLEYLYNEGRCNIRAQDHDRREMILPIGRRSGKSTISAMVGSYETYKLIKKFNPQKFYGTPDGAPIQICSIATSRDQAAILYKEVRRHFNNCQFFQQYMDSETQTQVLFKTPHDIETSASPSLRLTFYSAVAKGVRGAANITAIMDEVAFFPNTGQASSYEVYQALSPSLAQFSPKDPNNTTVPLGNSHGRMIMISSPYTRAGLFFDQYEMSLSGRPGARSLLMIQAPTWEVNPTLPHDYYEKEFEINSSSFMTEFGAQFTDKVKAWIERDEDLTDCIIPDLKPVLKGYPRERHYLGLDLAPRGDRTVITLTKVVDDKIRLVYHEQWQAKTDWYTINPHLSEPLTPYAKSLSHIETLDYDEIVLWIEALSRRYYIVDGLFDRYEGIGFEQLLHKKGLKQLRMQHFSAALSSEIYQAFKILLFTRKVELYDYVLDDDTQYDRQSFAPYIQEILQLQGISKGKNLVTVQGPQTRGKYDDFCDSLVRSLWLAAKYLAGSGKHSSGHSVHYASQGVGDRYAVPTRSFNGYQRAKLRRRSYSSKRFT